MTLYRDMPIISIVKKKGLRKYFIGDMTAREKRLSTREWRNTQKKGKRR